MNVSLKNRRGFTFVEMMFVGIITSLVMVAIISVWLFTYRTWIGESQQTTLRVDMVRALETIRNDIRLSSITYMVFYPAGGEPYSAVSMPVAAVDANGFFKLDPNGDIDWDTTVIYHPYTGVDGSVTLRRTVYDPRDNGFSDAERYSQLQSVVSAGSGGTGSTTDTDFLENVEAFEVSSLSPIIDFYADSSSPIKSDKVVFGWVKLDPGDHTIKLEITGKHSSSSGYDLGVDTLMIEPSGSIRDAEYYASTYAPSGSLTTSGGSTSLVNESEWSNDNFLKFDAGGVGSYIEIEDYYDLLRESSFDSCSLSNTSKAGTEVRIALDTPKPGKAGDLVWFAYSEAEDSSQEGHDGFGNPADPTLAPTHDIVIRTIVSRDNIDVDPDAGGDEVNFIRIKFQASDSNPLRIERAYITRKDASGAHAYDGLPNDSPAGKDPDEYHRHQQIFFNDGAGNITATLNIGAGEEIWSEWLAFPLIVDDSGADVDYFVTYCMLDVAKAGCKYWEGTETNSFYIEGDYAVDFPNAEGIPDWSTAGYTVNTADDVFAVVEIDATEDSGSVESQVFDTGKASPAYSEVKWSEFSPSGTEITLKVRSSSSAYMDGAADWADITGTTNNPGGLSISSERYVQFLAEIDSTPFWETSGAELSYAGYITAQLADGLDYTFPVDGSENYVAGLTTAWLDDVEIDWPGGDRICTITGIIARENDFGQAKVTIDGEDLLKILSVHVKASIEYQDRQFVEDNYVEVQPRNTGK